jgi:hypothetical protein
MPSMKLGRFTDCTLLNTQYLAVGRHHSPAVHINTTIADFVLLNLAPNGVHSSVGWDGPRPTVVKVYVETALLGFQGAANHVI